MAETLLEPVAIHETEFSGADVNVAVEPLIVILLVFCVVFVNVSVMLLSVTALAHETIVNRARITDVMFLIY